MTVCFAVCFQADFSDTYHIEVVATQGRGENHGQWVTTYKFAKYDNVTVEYYRDPDTDADKVN